MRLECKTHKSYKTYFLRMLVTLLRVGARIAMACVQAASSYSALYLRTRASRLRHSR